MRHHASIELSILELKLMPTVVQNRYLAFSFRIFGMVIFSTFCSYFAVSLVTTFSLIVSKMLHFLLLLLSTAELKAESGTNREFYSFSDNVDNISHTSF